MVTLSEGLYETTLDRVCKLVNRKTRIAKLLKVVQSCYNSRFLTLVHVCSKVVSSQIASLVIILRRWGMT